MGVREVVIENPVINAAFDEPGRHFRFNEDGSTDEIVAGRRPSAYFIPIARPKKKGEQPAQGELWTEDRLRENDDINEVRTAVGAWRALGAGREQPRRLRPLGVPGDQRPLGRRGHRQSLARSGRLMTERYDVLHVASMRDEVRGVLRAIEGRSREKLVWLETEPVDVAEPGRVAENGQQRSLQAKREES